MPSPARAHVTGGTPAREWVKLLRVGLSAGIRAPTGPFAQLRADLPAPLSLKSTLLPPGSCPVPCRSPLRGAGAQRHWGGRPKTRRSSEGCPPLIHSGARLSSHHVDAAEMQPLQGVPRGPHPHGTARPDGRQRASGTCFLIPTGAPGEG